MAQITRNVAPDAVRDLVARPPRACLAFAGPDGPQLTAVGYLQHAASFWVGLTAGVTGAPALGQEVVLLLDAGQFFFDLRAVYIRGTLQATDPPPSAGSDLLWHTVVPRTTIAWDYGQLQEVPDALE